MDIVSLWDKTLQLIKGELSPPSFNAFFKQIIPLKIHMNELILLVPNDFTKGILEDRYLNLIESSINQLSLKKYKVKFVLDEKYVEGLEEEPKSSNIPQKNYPNLNPKYTFDTFVIGNSNRFAHAACVAVAESPARAYNPLFLYGGVGLGKTHLMHAIGHQVIKNNPNSNVLYVTSEKFTNQLINAIKDNKNEQFRNKYRNIDVLLIDDIQFIAGKERIQEEFFHTFNTLHDNRKQIVISSDRPPKDIPLLEDRLKSRFEWGLIADISIPDYETRLAILRKKAQTDNIIVDDVILSTIATRVASNIRELEGVFNKLVAFSTLANGPITIEMAEKAINDISAQKEKVISADYIQDVVAKYFNINKKDLKSSKRSNDIAYPRQIAMYLCREVAGLSFPKIGEEFGKRDHTTVMHGCNKIEKEIKENTNTKLIVESVKKIILEKK